MKKDDLGMEIDGVAMTDDGKRKRCSAKEGTRSRSNRACKSLQEKVLGPKKIPPSPHPTAECIAYSTTISPTIPAQS
jgi:hypothetical protein